MAGIHVSRTWTSGLLKWCCGMLLNTDWISVYTFFFFSKRTGDKQEPLQGSNYRNASWGHSPSDWQTKPDPVISRDWIVRRAMPIKVMHCIMCKFLFQYKLHVYISLYHPLYSALMIALVSKRFCDVSCIGYCIFCCYFHHHYCFILLLLVLLFSRWWYVEQPGDGGELLLQGGRWGRDHSGNGWSLWQPQWGHDTGIPLLQPQGRHLSFFVMFTSVWTPLPDPSPVAQWKGVGCESGRSGTYPHLPWLSCTPNFKIGTLVPTLWATSRLGLDPHNPWLTCIPDLKISTLVPALSVTSRLELYPHYSWLNCIPDLKIGTLVLTLSVTWRLGLDFKVGILVSTMPVTWRLGLDLKIGTWLEDWDLTWRLVLDLKIGTWLEDWYLTWRLGLDLKIGTLVPTMPVTSRLGLDPHYPWLTCIPDLEIGTLVLTLPCACHLRVSARTGWPGVSWQCRSDMASMTCSFCPCVAACQIVYAGPHILHIAETLTLSVPVRGSKCACACPMEFGEFGVINEQKLQN